MTALIPIEHQVDLGKLYRFYNLKGRMLVARNRYYKMYVSSITLAATYLDDLPEAKTIIRLRREIRLATKGMPQTIAEDAVTSAGYLSNGTEQLYNAQSHLVKNAYRMVVGLVHPDLNGDLGLFEQVNAAYRMRDLTFLQDLYLSLVKDNVFWRCSDEAHAYMEQEIQRPDVSLQRLRNKPEFQIVMHHRVGRPDLAKEFAAARAKTLIYILQAELNHLLNPNDTDTHNGNDNEEKGSSGKAGSQGQGFRDDKDDAWHHEGKW